jgi:hypothetical protein
MSVWQTVRIGGFCAIGSGGTPSRDNLDRYYEGGTIPWVKSGELREAIINDTEEHVTDLALKETNVASQVAQRPHPTRHRHTIHFYRPLRRPNHESKGVADKTTGFAQPGDDFAGGVPLIRVGDLFEGRVNHASLKFIAPT